MPSTDLMSLVIHFVRKAVILTAIVALSAIMAALFTPSLVDIQAAGPTFQIKR